MAIERTEEMIDIADRPVYVGDIICIPDSARSGAALYIIKNFSSYGIFGWRLTPYPWENESIMERIDRFISAGELYLSKRYASSQWGWNYGFNNRVTKVEREALEIPESKYKRILELMGVENEFKPAGTVKL